MMRTWLTERIGVEFPVVCGAFNKFGTAGLATAVSGAGGLGMLTSHCYEDAEGLRDDLRRVRSVTSNPVAVNFTVRPPEVDGRAFRAGKSAADFGPWLDVALEERVGAVFTSAYDGSPLGLKAREAGIPWISKSATIKHALSACRRGADGVVIVGLEGTGFKNPSQNTTLINLTAMRRMTKTPVLAAGGIADGRGLAAALCLGACGVYLGTAFMATAECPITEARKRSIVEQDITDEAFHKAILIPGGHDRVVHSMASVALDSIPTVAEFMEKMMREADEALRGVLSPRV